MSLVAETREASTRGRFQGAKILTNPRSMQRHFMAMSRAVRARMPGMARGSTVSKTSKPTSRMRSRTSTPPVARRSSSRSRSMFDVVRGLAESVVRCSSTDISQVIFFKTQAPVEPVSFVHRICSDAVQDPDRKRSRWTRRLTPMTTMGKATEKGLEEVSKAVLAPHFHAEGVAPKKVRRPSHFTPMAQVTAAPFVIQDITTVAVLPVMVEPVVHILGPYWKANTFYVGGVPRCWSFQCSSTVAWRSGRGRADQTGDRRADGC